MGPRVKPGGDVCDLASSTESKQTTTLDSWFHRRLSLQRRPVPVRVVGTGLVAALQELQQHLVRRSRGAHRLVGQDELPDVLFLYAGGSHRRFAETGGLGIGIGVERRLAEAAIARPEAAAADLVRIGLLHHPVAEVRAVARERRRGAAGKAG